jgi:hypothetical protein
MIESGCERCRTGIYAGGPEPHFVAATAGNALFYRCAVCGTWWESDARSLRPISTQSAREELGDLFHDERPATG